MKCFNFELSTSKYPCIPIQMSLYVIWMHNINGYKKISCFILDMHMLRLENYRLDTEYENQLIIKVTLVCIFENNFGLHLIYTITL